MRDHPVVPAFAAVNDTRAVGSAVDEEEEVVPDELHMVERVFDGHVRRGEHLATNDDGRIVVVGRSGLGRLHGNLAGEHLLDDVWTRGRDVHDAEAVGGGLAQRGRTVLAAVHLLAILGLAHPFDQFGDGQVERDVLVGARRLGAHERTRPDESELDPIVAARPAGFVVTRHLDVEGDRLVGEMIYLLGLVDGVLTEPVRDPQVSSADGNFHGDLPASARCAPVLAPPPGWSRRSISRAFCPTVVLPHDVVTECEKSGGER